MYTTLRKHPYLTLLFVSFFLYLIGNQLLPITDTAESNYALTAKEMVLSGDWISPQIYGHYWYDKPIFYYWELALSYTLFGFNEMASRLPAALAVLTKGPIGLLLPGLAALLFLSYNKDLKEMKHVHLFSGLALFAMITGAWYGTMCYLHGSDFLLNFLGVHNFLRATVSEHPSQNKWYYYLMIYFIGFAPWSFSIPYSLTKKWRFGALDFRNASNVTQLLLIYFVVVNLFFTLIATKYTTYTFPGLFALAILTAVLYQDLTWRFERIGCAAIAIYTLLTLFIAPGIMLHRSGKEAGQALARMDTTGKTIAFLHDYRTSTVFYSGQTIYRAEPALKIDAMRPGTLSWNAKNVMPFIAEEDLFQKDNVILIAQDKSQEPCLIAFKEARHVSELRIPGLYDLWILQRA